MKIGDYVVTMSSEDGFIAFHRFGEDKGWAERCYDNFNGSIITLYVVARVEEDGDFILIPIKSRKEEK